MSERSRTVDEQLLATVYGGLKGLAARQMAGERAEHTLQATALAHEAWLSLKGHLDELRDEPARLYAAAADAMRHILIDHARRRGAQKRGGGLGRLPLDIVEVAETASFGEVIELDEAIGALGAESPRSAEVVRLRFYTGLGEEEVARTLGISVRTVRREWAYARAWLFRRLRDDATGG